MDSITLEIPKKYHASKKAANFLQYYLESAMEKGIEMIQDMQLHEDLSNDKDFINLHDQFAKKIWNM